MNEGAASWTRPSQPVMLRSMTTILVVVAAAYAIIWSRILGYVTLGMMIASVGVAGLLVPPIYRWTGSFSASTHWFTFLIFAPVVVLVIATGGVASPVMMWFIAVPLAAMMLDGPRTAAPWLVVVLVETALIGLIDPHQLQTSHTLTPYAVRLLTTTGVVVLSISIFLCLYLDFRSLSKAHEQLRYQAHHDNLTGLLNRHALLSRLTESLAAPGPTFSEMSLILIDIDFFKQINDEYGHLAGDKALQEVARRIRQNVRTGDRVGRYGGEEFLCVLPNCSPSVAFQIAESIREAVERDPIDVGAAHVTITVSLGVSGCPQISPCDEFRAIQCADAALYEAKRNGRNQTRAAGRCHSAMTAV